MARRPFLNSRTGSVIESSSKTVMGHWPIESSNLSLSAPVPTGWFEWLLGHDRGLARHPDIDLPGLCCLYECTFGVASHAGIRYLGDTNMKRLTLSALAAFGLMLASMAPVYADAGAPGTTFPEQPGSHLATACNSVLTNPGTGLGVPASPTAGAITTGLVADACFG